MGEVEVSSGEGAIMDMEEEKGGGINQEEQQKNRNSSKEGSMVRWERFLPRMALRVLLVEADYSTRQIISALLRKCSYKVAAVPNGLKAWEVLKGRPHNIDLILVEVDLPSISGFALLTLIMEHEICKNIPVIMMSSHDSVSTVYKCMLRGAADFLMKPIRINELKNLWQHVWRRQSSIINGLGPPDESTARQKFEATAENNAAAASDHSSGSKAFPQQEEDCLKKGSDAQSSCAKPDVEAESSNAEEEEEDVQDISSSKQNVPDTKRKELHEANSRQNLNDRGHISSGGLHFAGFKISDRGSHDVVQTQGTGGNNLHSEVCEKSDSVANSCREAIDLIGSFTKQSNCSYGGLALSSGEKMSDSPELNLSLRRSPIPISGSERNSSFTCQKHTVIQSNASAFSRYVNKQMQPTSGSIVSAFTPRETQINSIDHSSDHMTMVNKAGGGKVACGQQRLLYPVPVTVKGVDSTMQQLNPPDRSFSIEQVYSDIQMHQSAQQEQKKKEEEEEYPDDRAGVSSAADRSGIGSGSLSNSGMVASHLHGWGSSAASGNNGCYDSPGISAPVRNPAAADSGNEENMSAQERNCQRSLLREAALTKFRLKRKERCYEKKVRYESRKKLAEQRPRVKGQFVRQLPTEPAPPAKPENSFGNSVGATATATATAGGI